MGLACGQRGIADGLAHRDGCLITDPNGERAAIRTRQAFQNFEMTSNGWFRERQFGSEVPHLRSGRGGRWRSPRRRRLRYQVADDDGDAGARVDARQKSGALYAVVPVSRPASKPVGEWNESRILLASDHVEHWLNGVETARYVIDTPFASRSFSAP